MRMRRWPLVAECDTCDDHVARMLKEPKPRCAVYDSVIQQLENCRETIELALQQLAHDAPADRPADAHEDIFSYGPQGAD